MPRLQVKVEGRGNGLKTRIVNCADVAAALHRSPSEVCKFRGTTSLYNAKTDRALVNGVVDTHTMQSHLSTYIEDIRAVP
ncbi:hypothetical protein JG687_00018014 [Phytophthora cactorum]|uniref:Translation initiation factor IF2/IF5 domain-containing protein n=1 Tax=Phytophthora cactorum TaxID=29920 RepID=A0A329RKH1_9STRA|nr:hypothetical protein Pcac1_g19595 [Phytophthora cactorum]KAG2802361.1 hypothetical protein PC112_g19665 [Phytophthora cactorum]KAG2803231.1 hypothetical protein PC111_g18770 [Phytophthora cactorum]KAG2832133.1 hypothetical protein PC113_g20806 [Phytophthora cactorum]KAG2878511.1 hypothetical protein PC114_g23079 [Phytophthora cactorum]